MEIAKLEIIPEKEGAPPGASLQFDDKNPIRAMFNPKLLTFSRSVAWTHQDAKDKDVPELQYGNAQPRTLTLDLFFDTYDTPTVPKEDVNKYTNKLLKLTTFDSTLHRPPVCQLRWGDAKVGGEGYFFQGVLERLEQKYTMFLDSGLPVRATLTCSFKEWRTNYENLNQQRPQSADVAKLWLLKRGDSLSNIAAKTYRDPSFWRHIATQNNIDNPLDLRPGHLLTVPMLSLRQQAKKGRGARD